MGERLLTAIGLVGVACVLLGYAFGFARPDLHAVRLLVPVGFTLWAGVALWFNAREGRND